MTTLPLKATGGRSTNHSLRASVGMVILVAVLMIAFAFYLSLAIAIYPQHDKGFEVVERGPYIHSYDPIALAELGLPPNSSNASALPANPEVRAMSLYGDRLVLTTAGVVTSNIPLARPITNLQELKDVLNNPSWIEESSEGIYTLKAAFISYSPMTFTIGEPQVREVQMLDMPSVFIGVKGGTLTFNDVVVRAVDTGQRGSDLYQPFVMATGNAELNMIHSVFSNLGWDWNASYGVSWEHGSTGTARESIFENSFIGAYTSRAERLSFFDCIFRDNHLYGLDPHTYSKNLTIDHVTAKGNGAHGIIFSDHVTDSVVRNSTAFANGENGIMMDQSSAYNLIENNNVYQNSGDGLVTASSTDNTFSHNSVYENRVGVRIDQADVQRTSLTGNTVVRNNKAFENAEPDASNTIQNNGGQWNFQAVADIWMVTGAALLVFGSIFLMVRNARNQRRSPVLKLVE